MSIFVFLKKEYKMLSLRKVQTIHRGRVWLTLS